VERSLIALVTLLSLLPAIPLMAQDQDSLEAMTKKTQNPVADQIKVQFENYFNFETGTINVTQYVQNVIPTVPFKLTEDWNLIIRTALPIINDPSTAPGSHGAFGVGDLNPTLYFVPRKHRALSWGLGPTFTLPTATAKLLGSGDWSAGPAAVVVTTSGPWVLGTRINNEWSFAGWSDHHFNQMWIQPFVHYNLSNGWYLATLPSYTANWNASNGNVWTVPLGGGLGKHWRVGGGGLDAQVQVFSNVKHPAGASSWQLLCQVEVVHPK
jgi:hypothetical protein